MKTQWIYKSFSASLIVILAFVATPTQPAYAAACTFTSIATGTWTTAGTWSAVGVACSTYPGQTFAGDTVVIANGHIVTLNISPAQTIASLQVGQGVSGTLTLGDSNVNRTLSITGNITVNAGGILQTAGNGGNQLNMGGNLSNAGTVDMNIGGADANVTFNGTANQTISGAGGTTDFDTIVINNTGAVGSNIIDVTSTNFTAANGFLTLTNGIFRLSTGVTIAPVNGNTTLGAAVGFVINHTSAIVNWGNNNLTVAGGVFQLVNGTFNIGNGNLAVSSGTIQIDTGSVAITNGNINVSGGLFDFNNGTLTNTDGSITVSGGTFDFDNGTITNTNGDFNVSSGVFDMSAGTLTTGDGNDTFDTSGTGNTTLSGGTVNVNGRFQMRNASTTTLSGATINLDPKVTTNLANGQDVFEAQAASNVTFSAGTVTIIDAHNGSAGGNAVQIVAGAGTKNLSGSTIQFGNGVSTTIGSLDGFDMNCGAGVTLGNVIVNNLATNIATRFVRLVTNDCIIGGNFTITDGTFLVNGLNLSVRGNFTNNDTFTTGGANTVTLDGTAAQTIGGSVATTFNNLTISNANGVSLSGVNATVSNTLALGSSKLTTGANTVIMSLVTGVTRTTGFVEGNLRKPVAAGSPTITYEVGTGTSYSPITVSLTGAAVGTLTGSATSGLHPQFASSGLSTAKYVNRYWTLTSSGFTFTNYNITSTFVAGDLIGAPNTSAILSRKYNASWATPTSSSSTATTVTGTGYTTSFGDFIGGEINNLPTGGNGSVPTNEDTLYTFTVADFTTLTIPAYSDAESDPFAGIRVTSLETAGDLECGGVDVLLNGICANVTTLTFNPAANANGSPYATFGFQVYDGTSYSVSSYTMTINVTAVNDVPSFTASNPAAVNEDAGAQSLAGWATFSAGPANESGQIVSQYIISGSTCGTLLSAGPAVDTTGQLTYTPATNENGTCTFDVAVQDNGGGTNTSPNQNFTITVNAVNDVPSFTATDPAAVNEDAGLQTVSGWVTVFNPGPANESGQAVSAYNVTIGTCGTLLTGTPSVNTAGDLSYTPAANQNGTCIFNVAVQDNGGTANGGIDTSSPTQNFTITVNAVDDASTANDDSATVAEDASATTINVRGNDTDIDSAVENITSVTQPTNGTVVITNAGADLTYQPDANYCNNGTPTDDFTYTLTNGSTATVSVTVTCVDDASTANDDSATIAEDASATTINVRSNDTDIDSAVENITSVTQPTNGTVVITNAGADLTYQPDANYCNDGTPTDDFNYTLTNGSTATVSVTVTCVDDASTANDDTATVWEDSGTNTINVRSNDTDIDSTVENITSVTQPTNGTVVITNAGADLTYQPDADYCNSAPVPSTDDFTYTLTGGNSATVRVTVTCQTVITANITANNKVYDGDNTATFTCSLTGVTPPDVVTCTGGTATFADKNVGNGKLVTATGLGITGADAFKYELTSTSATDNADITERTLNVTATGIDKIYDGNTTATVTLSDDRFLGDLLTVSYTSASFVDPNVGVNITINVSGISITGGADQANYVLGNTTAVTDADITIAGQTINVTTNAPTSAANGTSFNVVATATSGLPVTITVSGVCTIGDVDGSTTDGDATITMTSGTGICSVFYNQAGNSNYSAAPQVQEDVNATDSPVFTSADNTTFDFGFSGNFAITATGNPSTMSITMTGAPTGVTISDNGDGTATLDGDGTTPVGVYNIVLTANNGVNPNGTQNFTLTVRNGPVVGLVNSNPDTGNGNASENESILNTLNITQLIVVFNRDVYDPAGDTDPDDVTNPANYVLVRSATGTFATSTCAGGVTAPDISIAVDSVTYDNITFTATLNVNGGLPLNVNGFYRLFVCGTTSIVDATNPLLNLAGDGVNPGTDFIRNFRITAPTSGGGGGNNSNNSGTVTSTNLSGVLIPVTGFTPNQVTKLPAQSIGNAYTASKLRIEIPSLSMDLPIVGIALKDKQFDVTWLGNNAGYLEGSAYPTWQGNSILTGHVTDANGKPGPFAYVNELKTGDQIYIHNNGFIYVYEVRESKLILPNKINDLFKHEEDYWLTLVTCENFDTKSETFTHRRIVRAVLISILPAK